MNDLSKYLTVTALTRYIKYKIDNDNNLRQVFLKGEISNFKAHSTGHLYFSVKDETSKINAIMFATNAKKLNFIPMDGNKVLIIGRISVYESTGNYQIYVDEMLQDGLGNLYLEFEKLKAMLEKEGLFDNEKKKRIPLFPEKIGIITAPTGAAIKDILSTIKRRYPICDTYLFPSLVQGESAADDIVKNIHLAENYNFDVLIVGRGGGSIEDLWPFNEEKVARAIYECSIPIISAVGHEIDYTIADFVADLRAPTPTGAAELAVPNITDLIKHINQLKIRLDENINTKINYQKLKIETFKNSFVIKNPMLMFENYKQKLDILIENLNKSIFINISTKRLTLDNLKNNYIIKKPEILFERNKVILKNLIDKLELVSPLNIIKKGYSLVYKNDLLIKSITDVSKDDKLKIKLNDGYIISKVLDKE
ncbi:MAG: exodeoxyribonuclease VII large subunit [Clostridium sp.]|nr:exodeoxyribonuclease VII large subunit [Clostridium sp.]MCM1443988.1 exodeoxyribonuclease VII large subunit [Candidatus Amulumruptor caecigallinarius]